MNAFFSAKAVMLISDLRLSLADSIWFYVFAVFAVSVFAFIIYRFTLPPVSKTRKGILWALRAVALSLLIFLIFEPLLTFFRKTERRPVIAVILDRSASMSVLTNREDRARALYSIAENPLLKEQSKHADMRTFMFSDSVFEVKFDRIRDIPLNGVGSDIAGAWNRTQKLLSTENLAAVILVTDGAFNLGENPVRAAAVSSVPIFTVGIGDTISNADAYIGEITTNDLTYAGSRVPLDVRVHARGLPEASSVVKLVGPGDVVLSQQGVRFVSDESEAHISFAFEARESGDMHVTVVLDSVNGESTLNNNRRSAIVRVLERKAVVVLISGSPGADLTILRQMLDADTTAEVTPYIEINTGRYLYDAMEPAADDLAKASLIILNDFPTANSSQILINTVQQTAVEKRIPILFFAGPHISTTRLATLKSVLPLESPRSLLTEEAVLTREAASHPAFSASTALPAEWSDLPPVYGGIGNFSVSGGGHVAVKLSRETLGILEDEPGLVMWEMAGRRSAAILCWGTARWKLQLAGNSLTTGFYEQALSRLRGWLIAPIEEPRVKIRTTKKVYSGGEAVRFNAQVYGADLQPRDDAALGVRVTFDKRTESVFLKNRGNGRYEGEFSPWTVGEYRFVGVAVAGNDTLGADNGLFAVEPFNFELFDSRARFDVLRRIAVESGGSFTTAEHADTMLFRMKFKPQPVVTRHEVSLWRHGPVIWFIIALLALEWIIRKRSGML